MVGVVDNSSILSTWVRLIEIRFCYSNIFVFIYQEWCPEKVPWVFAFFNQHRFYFNSFQCLLNSCPSLLPRRFLPVAIARFVPSPAILISISVNSCCCHTTSISSQVHNSYCGEDFFFFFLYFIKGPFHVFHQVCNNLMHIPRSPASVLPDMAILNSTIVTFKAGHITTAVWSWNRCCGTMQPTLLPLCAWNAHPPIPSRSLFFVSVVCFLITIVSLRTSNFKRMI